MHEQMDQLQKSLGDKKRTKNDKNGGNENKCVIGNRNPWQVLPDDIKNRDDRKHAGKQTEKESGINKSSGQHSKGNSKHRSSIAKPNKGPSLNPTAASVSISASTEQTEKFSKKDLMEEETRKEEERLQLIWKIEEARLRDLEKAEQKVKMYKLWDDMKESPEKSPAKNKARDDSEIKRLNRKRPLEEPSDECGVDKSQSVAASDQEATEKETISTIQNCNDLSKVQ